MVQFLNKSLLEKRWEQLNKRKSTRLAGDFLYTLLATAVLNAATQIVIFPLITRIHGDSVTGNILYFMGIIYIVPQALGTTLNNARLVIRKSCDVVNSDFNQAIMIMSGISALVCGLIGFFEGQSISFCLGYAAFSVIYMLRIYAQVEFRLVLKFKEYFLYFCIISVGYIAGFFLYAATDIWLCIFITGEAAALVYTLTKGTIFKQTPKTDNRSKIHKTVFILFLSTIVRDCVNQFDKIILKQAIRAEVVTQYHVVSLMAKTIQMLVQPVNALILSYLTVKNASLSRKALVKFMAVSLAVGAIAYGGCIVGTPILVGLFYPDLYAVVMPYNLFVNLGLIVGFVASMFMAVLLSQEKTVLHMVIQCVWGAGYIAAVYFFIDRYALWGLIGVTLAANSIKLVVAICGVFWHNE